MTTAVQLSDRQQKLAQRIARAGIALLEQVTKAMINRGDTRVKVWIDKLIEHDKQRLEDAIRTNPIEATIERFTGQQIVKHKILAPWRNENTPSLHVYDDGKWFDFGTGEGGDVIDFVGRYYFGSNYDPTTQFTDVIDRLSGLNIAPLPAQTVRPTPEPIKQLSIDLETILDWHDTMPKARREYWLKRGLFDKTIDEFFLGWDGKRYTIPALYRLVPFGVKRRQSEIDDGIDAKYISATGSRAGLFNSDCLWTTDKVVICEGEIDAMLLNQWGFPAVTSTAGAGTFKEKWAELFLFVPNIWILYDNDDAGRKGEQLVHSILRRAKIIHYPQTIKDCGELFEKDPQAVNWLYESLV
jgi:DNA primase